MPDYKKLYFALFNEVSDCIEALKQVQRDAEERYLLAEEQEESLAAAAEALSKQDR